MAAAGLLPQFEIFGDDYDTADGTCVRDFIHVTDLAAAHVTAVQHILKNRTSLTANLGTGKGFSIRQILNEVEAVTNRKIPVLVSSRRPGDPPQLVASAHLARTKLGFTLNYSDIRTIVSTASRQYSFSEEI
jgi:UDP-arabinose 4-epimerase